MDASLETTINAAWEERNSLGPETRGEVRLAVDKAIAALDAGEARIALKANGQWVVSHAHRTAWTT